MLIDMRRSALLVVFACSGCSAAKETTPSPDPQIQDPQTIDAGSDATPRPADDAGTTPRATHQGAISIQDRQILGLPQAGHGLSVLVDLTRAARRPDYDEAPGAPTGCKVWSYDVATDPPPESAGDVGTLVITGTSGPLGPGCTFDARAGYVCRVAEGNATIAVRRGAAPQGTADYEIAGATFGPADRGRYLQVEGDADAAGSFPIVAVVSPTVVRVPAKPGGDHPGFTGRWRVLAGAGPTPGLPHEADGDPLRDGDGVTVHLEPSATSPFRFPDVTVKAGASFQLDAATAALLAAIPTDGRSFSLGCDGAGGTCGPADGTVIQMATTDGPTTDLPPFAMPPPSRKQVILTCAQFGGATVTIPEAASRLLQAAHAASPITRIRTAFMRNGLGVTKNPTPPDNTVRVVAGHQMIGFSNPTAP